jgi:hypothetical protein
VSGFRVARLDASDVERFWSNVDKSPGLGPTGECWLWCSGLSGGYGSFSVGKMTLRAHRVAFFLAHGRWPVGPCLHHCDTPACMRHTYDGTLKRNTADMMRRGRNVPPRGERQGNSKLTAEQVREIRESTDLQADIAARYGIRQSNVSMIRGRRRWGHV